MIVVIIFALVLTRHFSDVEVASCRLQRNGCSAFSILLSQLSLKRGCGREKKEGFGFASWVLVPNLDWREI